MPKIDSIRVVALRSDVSSSAPRAELDRLIRTLEPKRNLQDRCTSGLSWPRILTVLGPKGRAGEATSDDDLSALPNDSRALRAVVVWEKSGHTLRWVDTEAVAMLDGVEIHHQELGTDASGRTSFVREGYIYAHQLPAAPAAATAIAAVPATPKERPSIESLLSSSRVSLQLMPNDTPLVTGLGVSPGGASGVAAFDLQSAKDLAASGKLVILIKEELRPDETSELTTVAAMIALRGGYSSHASVVARERGVAGVNLGGLPNVAVRADGLHVGNVVVRAGDAVSVDGQSGAIYLGARKLIAAVERPEADALVAQARLHAPVRIYANADTVEQVSDALRLGADGVGLVRTEHMFLSKDARAMLQTVLLAPSAAALQTLEARSQSDFAALFAVAKEAPIKVRLLDPPAHEFLPHEPVEQRELALRVGLTEAEVQRRVEAEREANPMLGLRGVRLGMARPDIYEAQLRALLRASAETERATQKPVALTVIVPMVSAVSELDAIIAMLDRVHRALEAEGTKVRKPQLACMIETPAAVFLAAELATRCDAFCFGSNDLTQMTLGVSRDDVSRLPKRTTADPFARIEEATVGKLIAMAVEQGRAANPHLQISLCGAQASDGPSLAFLHRAGVKEASVSVSTIRRSWLIAGELAPPVSTYSPVTIRTARAAVVAKPGSHSDRLFKTLKQTRPEPPQHSRKWTEIVAANPGEAGFVPFGDDSGLLNAVSPNVAARQPWIRVIYGDFPEGRGFRFATEKALEWCMANTGHQGMDPERCKVREGHMRIVHATGEVFVAS